MNHPAATSKHDNYATAAYRLQFLTPAFMGDANQNGRWRTPPIKALLRQWWRVAYAADKQFAVRVDEMRHAEGMLFGHASQEHAQVQPGHKFTASKSLLRMRLDHWRTGRLEQAQWPKDKTVNHPEVRNGGPIGSNLYLGYGPLTYNKHNRSSSLKANAAIQADEIATLSIAYPKANAGLIDHALWLMHHYGTLGGRSRNGWGSFALAAEGDTPEPKAALHPRDWRQCLNIDWPHAIGQDDKGPLIWQTEAMTDWQAVMHHLAQLKIGLRTQFKFNTGKNALHPEDRHWLSYPVTNHSVRIWDNNARLPNTLRFKIRTDVDNPSKLRGVIFHVPCLPPAEFKPEVRAIEDVWQQVHIFLGAPAQKLERIPE